MSKVALNTGVINAMKQSLASKYDVSDKQLMECLLNSVRLIILSMQ